MPSISIPTALLGAGVVGAGASAVSGFLGSSAATQAAGLQADAATQAAQMQSAAAVSAAAMQAQAADYASRNTLRMFNKTTASLQPFVTAGQGSLPGLESLANNAVAPTTTGQVLNLGDLQQPFKPTMAQLAATPGYQFSLQQGEQGVTNSAAAQGLGQSGAALKGAANYAEGLAGTTFQQQFGNYLAQNSQIAGIRGQQFGANLGAQQQQFNQELGSKNLQFNQLGAIVSGGESAAAQQGTIGQGYQAQVNQLQTAAANAGAAGITGAANAGAQGLTSGAAAGAGGIIGSTNAITGSLGQVGSSASNTGLLLALNNGGLFGSGGGAQNSGG